MALIPVAFLLAEGHDLRSVRYLTLLDCFELQLQLRHLLLELVCDLVDFVIAADDYSLLTDRILD